MKKSLAALLITTPLLLASANTVSTPIVGFTKTTLPGGPGSLFAPSLVNSDTFSGELSGLTSGETSTMTLSGVSGDLSEGTFPKYYLEVLNDTDSTDNLDTEGLVFDIISNTEGTVTVSGNATDMGLDGTETVAIRKHFTLSDLFGSAEGLQEPSGDGTEYDFVVLFGGSPATYIYSGGVWYNGVSFAASNDAVIYPGTGILVRNRADVTVSVTGTVKETPTQVPLYAGSVNLVGSLKPVDSLDLSADGAIADAVFGIDETVTQYSKGDLNGVVTVLSDGTSLLNGVTFAPHDLVVDGTSDALLVKVSSDKVVKLTATSVGE